MNARPLVAKGHLAGQYQIVLASSSKEHKTLSAVLSVEEDQGWFLRFEVFKNETVIVFDGLAAAVRHYDEGNEVESCATS